MAEYEQVERFDGVHAPTGTQVRPKRTWGANSHWEGHRFTDQEVEQLLAGEKISFDATSKAGKPYTAQGYLKEGMYKDRPYWGFQLDFSGLPATFLGHTFTASEKATIEGGGKVVIEGLQGKKGPFDATVSYGKKEDGSEGIILSFD